MRCPCDAVLWCVAGELWSARIFDADSRPYVAIRASGRTMRPSDTTPFSYKLFIADDCPINENGVIYHD
jgi:hypothetical protein